MTQSTFTFHSRTFASLERTGGTACQMVFSVKSCLSSGSFKLEPEGGEGRGGKALLESTGFEVMQ